MDEFPFPEAIKKEKVKKKKKQKKVKRGGITCNCGALDKYWTGIGYFHEDFCIVNKGAKK